MRVIFNGVLEKKSGGCIPCGAKRASKQTMVTRKTFNLPSGAVRTFYVGREAEVSDTDGRFLMSYTYTDKSGKVQTVFTEVK